MMQKRQKSRTRKKSNKRHYFTQVHEDAIVRYARIDDIKERTVLYVDFIQPAFDEMVNKIIFLYSQKTGLFTKLKRTPNKQKEKSTLIRFLRI